MRLIFDALYFTQRRFKGVSLHLDCAFGSQIGLEHFLESFGSVDVNTEGGGFADDVGLSVDKL